MQTLRLAVLQRPSFLSLLVRSLSVLGRPQLVHLGDAHLELLILALLVCVTLVLHSVSARIFHMV